MQRTQYILSIDIIDNIHLSLKYQPSSSVCQFWAIKWFGEHVSNLSGGRHVTNTNAPVLNAFSYEKRSNPKCVVFVGGTQVDS